ncbi:MAG: inorganic diphosphatase [Patescibacteria group bacterium]
MDLKKISAGQKAPEEINVVIEIPQGSAVKYEFNEKKNVMEVDRFIGSTNVYPFNYGFIPETKADDGDPLDVMMISSLPVQSGAVVASRPIGLLEMEDEHGHDIKILAVPLSEVDPFYVHIKDLKDLDLATQERIKLFFKQYKEMESDRWSKVQNFGDKKIALIAIKKSLLKKTTAKKVTKKKK